VVTLGAFAGSRYRGSPPAIDQGLAAIAGEQHGLLTIAQLLDAGLSDGGVARWVQRGRLHRIHRGVYGLGHAALSREGTWLAAVLAAGERSALSHLHAAVLLQAWRRRLPPLIDVVTPSKRKPVGVRVHECRRLDPRDVTVFRGIPVTTMARTLVDLADDLSAERLASVIHEAAFRDRFDPNATRAAMERANGRRRLGVLERALTLHAGGSAGTRSDAEDAFLSVIRASATPEPVVNGRVEKLEVDFHWPDHRLCVEIDGPGHLRPLTLLGDKSRDHVLREAGWTVLRFTDRDLAQRPRRVAKQVARALEP
jgi:hypothetical protein